MYKNQAHKKEKFMNNTLNKFADYLKSQGFEIHTKDDNEDAVWFQVKLPNFDAAPLFFLSYTESTNTMLIMVSRMVRFRGVNTHIMQLINFFNGDPSTMNCKMFIDMNGELIVSCSCFLDSKDPYESIIQYMDITVSALDHHLPLMIEEMENSSDPKEAE
jgi:hypothetical protein